mgnify:CR=1 FL=1
MFSPSLLFLMLGKELFLKFLNGKLYYLANGMLRIVTWYND